jgi:hypothetical protein
MQARMPDSSTYSSSVPSHPQGPSSNIDLLAGLDFAVNTPPLVPQDNKSPAKTVKEEKIIKEENVRILNFIKFRISCKFFFL